MAEEQKAVVGKLIYSVPTFVTYDGTVVCNDCKLLSLRVKKKGQYSTRSLPWSYVVSVWVDGRIKQISDIEVGAKIQVVTKFKEPVQVDDEEGEIFADGDFIGVHFDNETWMVLQKYASVVDPRAKKTKPENGVISKADEKDEADDKDAEDAEDDEDSEDAEDAEDAEDDEDDEDDEDEA